MLALPDEDDIPLSYLDGPGINQAEFSNIEDIGVVGARR